MKTIAIGLCLTLGISCKTKEIPEINKSSDNRPTQSLAPPQGVKPLAHELYLALQDLERKGTQIPPLEEDGWALAAGEEHPFAEIRREGEAPFREAIEKSLFDSKNLKIDIVDVTELLPELGLTQGLGLVEGENLPKEGYVRRGFHITIEPGLPNIGAKGTKALLGRKFVHSVFLVIEVPEAYKDTPLSYDPSKGGLLLGDRAIQDDIYHYTSWPELHNYHHDFVERAAKVQVAEGQIFMEVAELDPKQFDFGRTLTPDSKASPGEKANLEIRYVPGKDGAYTMEMLDEGKLISITQDDIDFYKARKPPSGWDAIKLSLYELLGMEKKAEVLITKGLNEEQAKTILKVRKLHQRMVSNYNVFTFNCSHASAQVMAQMAINQKVLAKSLKKSTYPYELMKLLERKGLTKQGDAFTQFRKTPEGQYTPEYKAKPSGEDTLRPYKITAATLGSAVVLGGGAAAAVFFSTAQETSNPGSLALAAGAPALTIEEAAKIDSLLLELRAFQMDFLDQAIR
jgi:hypothetical protein